MKVNISKIKELAKEKGISIAFICKKFGMGRSYFNDILKSNGGDIPNDRLSIIIKILDTSLEYLTDQTDDKSAKPTLSTSDNQIQSNDSFDMFWERFVRLCIENNTKPNPVAKQLGISSGAVTRWKNGAVPHSTALSKIADFFGVPVSYFLQEIDESNEPEIINFKEIFTNLCNEKGEAPTTVCMKLGLSNAAYSTWTETTVPRRATLHKIAEYFNVPVDSLTGSKPQDMNTRIESLCKDNCTNITAMCLHLGIPRAVLSELKSGRTKSLSAENVLKIASYFKVSPEYIMGKTPIKNANIPAPSPEANAIFLNDKNIYMIPLFESVSAGFGACAVSDVLDYVPCYITNPADAENSICIKVTGDSMHPKIEDGDIIQVHRQTSVDSGQIAVILLDGEEGLVKKVVYGDNWIELHSINPMYPMQRFEGRDVLRIRVVGLVKTVIKNI